MNRGEIVSRKIRVVVADDVKETRKNIITLLEFESRIEVFANFTSRKGCIKWHG